MPSPDNALQTAIYTRLTNYAPLTSVLRGAKIYDFVKPKLAAPYVVIGEDTLSDDSTKTENGWDCTLTIHCWDFQKAGRKSVKAILGHLYDAIHRQEASVTVTGFVLTELIWDGFQTTIQETGIEGENDHFYHGVTRFRARIETT